jgi:hypothetical protein
MGLQTSICSLARTHATRVFCMGSSRSHGYDNLSSKISSHAASCVSGWVLPVASRTWMHPMTQAARTRKDGSLGTENMRAHASINPITVSMISQPCRRRARKSDRVMYPIALGRIHFIMIGGIWVADMQDRIKREGGLSSSRKSYSRVS